MSATSCWLRSWRRATGAAQRGSTIPILGCALLSVANGVMTIETTNMELAIRQQVEVSTTASWRAAVNIELLASISRRLPGDAEITLEPGDHSIILRSGRTRVSFRTLPIEDFPAFQDGGYTSEFTIAAPDLLKVLSRTAPFISDDASRYYLSGVHFSIQTRDGIRMLRAAATNGMQLAAAYLPAPGDGIPEIIVPRQAVGEIVKLLEGTNGSVALSVSHNKIKLVEGTTTLISKLIDGTFPEIDRVIPRDNTNVLRVDAAVFLRSLNLVSVMAERTGLRVVKLDIEASSLTLSTKDPEAGDAVEVIGAGDMEYDGEPMEIAFQPKYLIDVARLCGETVEFRFADAQAPFRVDNDDTVYVAMGARW